MNVILVNLRRTGQCQSAQQSPIAFFVPRKGCPLLAAHSYRNDELAKHRKGAKGLPARRKFKIYAEAYKIRR